MYDIILSHVLQVDNIASLNFPTTYYDLHVYKSVKMVKFIFIDKLTVLPLSESLRRNGKNLKEDEHIIFAASNRVPEVTCTISCRLFTLLWFHRVRN